jgi:hypothetical protein
MMASIFFMVPPEAGCSAPVVPGDAICADQQNQRLRNQIGRG